MYSEIDFWIPGAEFLMPLEVPLLKVSRPVAACQRCRSAKIKCDGILPACTACVKSGRAQQCSSGNSQFAPGKERSYVSTLEARVERLEARIADAKKRRQSSITMIDYSAPVTPASRSSSLDSLGRPKNKRALFRKELGTVDELVSDFGFLTVNANARDFQYGFTNSISYARLILAAASKGPLPTGITADLPNRTIALPLVRLYIENVLTLQPVLEEQDVYRSLDATVSEDQSNATPFDTWTVRMVLAISSATQSRQRGDSMYLEAIGHVCAALDIADQVLHPGSIYSIQAMLLLVQYSLLNPMLFDSWTLVGAASRAMIDIGLHQDPSKSSKTAKNKLELRRRVYYCVYCLDRSTSIVQTRAFSFSDDSATVGLPFSQKPQSPAPTSSPQNMWTKRHDVTLAYIRWRQIQSSWYTELFQSIRSPWSEPYNHVWPIYSKMTDWFDNLPHSTPKQIKDFLELDLLYSYVYILAPSPRCPNPSEHAQRLLIEHAMAYSSMVKRLQVEPASKTSPFTFYDALRVYEVARHFVDTFSHNLDVLLQPNLHNDGRFAVKADRDSSHLDPLAALPAPDAPPLRASEPADPIDAITRAIDTIDIFLANLSAFGDRFGYVSELSWRDRFQKEAQPLLAKLHSRLQQQRQLSPSESYFWTTHPGPVTPQQGTAMGTGAQHRLSASFYPSPATTQYSPNFVAQDIDQKVPDATSWQPGPAVPAYDFGNPAYSNEFGIGNMAAWETLPGGSMNARFT